MPFMKAIVVIPIYREIPNNDEICSLKQAFKVLSAHDICFVCPQNLNTALYEKIVKRSVETQRFSDHFFNNISAYSNLLVTNDFYKRFKSYDYMLIYQLDAWCFYDNLDYWCQQGYDYIGAPWFENYKCHENGAKLWRVGNGGFSLRKINYFLSITDTSLKLYTLREFFNRYSNSMKDLKKGISTILYRNFGWYRKSKKYFWEDVYFCDLNYKFKVPTPQIAAEFSFEQSPAFLYEQIGKLPFGCHAYKKNQYNEFWSKFIPQKTSSINQ